MSSRLWRAPLIIEQSTKIRRESSCSGSFSSKRRLSKITLRLLTVEMELFSVPQAHGQMDSLRYEEGSRRKEQNKNWRSKWELNRFLHSRSWFSHQELLQADRQAIISVYPERGTRKAEQDDCWVIWNLSGDCEWGEAQAKEDREGRGKLIIPLLQSSIAYHK